VRYAAELVYQPLISQWRQRYGAQLHYQPIVTREAKADALQQRIPELIQTGALQQACGQSLDQESQVLLCGNPQMINETRAVLERLGLRKNLRRDPGQITVEQYWK
jgi:ferredoxin/flavodoxin---NADP+ reductase